MTQDNEREAGGSTRTSTQLRWSTCLIGGLIIGCLLIVNVPGQVAWDMRHHGLWLEPVYVHGWPLPYLTRRGWTDKMPNNCWMMTSRVISFRPYYLAGNVTCGLLLVLVGTALWKVWRRRRKSILTFSLREVFMLVAACSMGAAWIGFEAEMYRREQRALLDVMALSSTETDPTASHRVKYEMRGPTFVRELCRDWDPLAFLDRVIYADDINSHPSLASRFTRLRAIHPNSLGHEDIAAIRGLRMLEELCIDADAIKRSSGHIDYSGLASFGSMRNLYRVKLVNVNIEGADWAWLPACPSIEEVDVDVAVDKDGRKRVVLDRVLVACGKMRKLETLWCEGGAVTKRGISALQANERLRAFCLVNVKLDRVACLELTGLTLDELVLDEATLDETQFVELRRTMVHTRVAREREFH